MSHNETLMQIQDTQLQTFRKKYERKILGSYFRNNSLNDSKNMVHTWETINLNLAKLRLDFMENTVKWMKREYLD